jgi:hypothetical protein
MRATEAQGLFAGLAVSGPPVAYASFWIYPGLHPGLYAITRMASF